MEKLPLQNRNWKTLLKKVGLIFLNIILLLGLSSVLYFKNQAPEGAQILSGLTQEPVNVYRDEMGNVHIFAETLEDMLFAQGYMEGMDRLYQCEMYRHATNGSLAQLMGDPSLIQDDLFMKAMYNDTIERGYQELCNNYQDYCYIQRYCDGLNYYIQSHKTTMPFEFKLMSAATSIPLNFIPSNFTIKDILRMGLAMGMMLTYSPSSAVRNWMAVDSLGWDNFTDLVGITKNNIEFNYSQMDLIAPPIVPDNSGDVTILTEVNSITPLSGQFESDIYRSLFSTLYSTLRGSNNWAVSPNRTAENGALICNDPHLDVGTPGIFKGWHLVCTDQALNYNAIGSSLPLVPLIVIGRTDYISWGVTTTIYDTTDSYVQNFTPDYSQYEYNGSWEDTLQKNYTVYVADHNPEEFTIVEVPNHGVLMQIDQYLVNVLWGSYNDEYHLMHGLISINFARSLSDFQEALDPENGWDHVLQNFVYGDNYGNIGFIAAGKIPIRGNNASYGIFPLNGSDPKNDWQGWITFENLPQEWNPTRGYVCTANSFTTSIGLDYPYYLTWGFYDNFRQNRIESMLDAQTNHSIETMNTIQGDTLNWWAPNITQLICDSTVNLEDPLEISARTKLVDWNGHFVKDSIAATIYFQMIGNLKENILADELSLIEYGSILDASIIINDEILANWLLDTSVIKNPNWFDDIATNQIENRTSIIIQSFQEAISQLRADYSADLSQWTWNNYFQINYEHPLGAQMDFLSFLNHEFNSDGGPCVRAFWSTGGSSIRFITSFGNDDTTSMVIPEGASGNYFSSYYSNQMDAYLDNDIVLWTSSQIALMNSGTQILVFNKEG